MESLLAFVLVGAFAFVMVKLRSQKQLQIATSHEEARLQHLRSGEYPATCSWCKNTTLAKKLFVFERRDQLWRSTDLMSNLTLCPPAQVDQLAPALTTDLPHWRRFCTERCTREFQTSEHIQLHETFVSCSYCSARIPGTLQRCGNCGANCR
jgi:hypothetical protein